MKYERGVYERDIRKRCGWWCPYAPHHSTPSPLFSIPLFYPANLESLESPLSRVGEGGDRSRDSKSQSETDELLMGKDVVVRVVAVVGGVRRVVQS